MRLALAYLGLLGAGFVILALWDPEIDLLPREAVREELRAAVSGDELGTRIIAALARGEEARARQYADVARLAALPLPRDAREAIERLGPETWQPALRERLDTETDHAGPAGLRDDTAVIAQAAERLTAGGQVDDLPLALAALSLGRQEGLEEVSANAPSALSILRRAVQDAALTPPFASHLGEMTDALVDIEGLKAALRADRLTAGGASATALGAFLRPDETGEMERLLAQFHDLRMLLGPDETVHLTGFMRSGDDAEELVAMAAAIGPATPGVVEITGKTSLRAFDSTLNVFDYIVRNRTVLATWLGGIFLLLCAGSFLRRLRPRA